MAPAFQVPRNIAAVSGEAGAQTATRSPRSTPCETSRLAARSARERCSAQLTSRWLPRKSSKIIAVRSGGWPSQTSAAMLYRSGTRQRCASHASS